MRELRVRRGKLKFWSESTEQWLCYQAEMRPGGLWLMTVESARGCVAEC